MKALFLSLTLLGAASALRAQDVAVTSASAPKHTSTPGQLVQAGRVERLTTSVSERAPAAAGTPPAHRAQGTPYESTSRQVAISVNGVAMQVQTLPASGTVLISFSMPPQIGPALLELASARTGEVVYSGTVLVSEGQVELPVSNVGEPFEARLATDQEVVIARMTR